MNMSITFGDLVVAATAGGSIMAAYLGISTRLRMFEARVRVFEEKLSQLVETVKAHDQMLHQLLGQQQTAQAILTAALVKKPDETKDYP